MKTFRIPPVYTLVAILAAMALNRLPVLVLEAPLAGTLVMLAGLGLALWAILVLRRHHTPLHPGETPRALVTSGPFRINRNPIYSGMVLITLGVGLSRGSLLGVLPALALWWLLDRQFARAEEERLAETFGEAGEAYVSRVRRW